MPTKQKPFSLDDLKTSGRSPARKVAKKRAAVKRKPTTVELLLQMRKFKWDFDAMKRA